MYGIDDIRQGNGACVGGRVVVDGILVMEIRDEAVGSEFDEPIAIDVENAGRVAEQDGTVVVCRDVRAAATSRGRFHAIAFNAVGYHQASREQDDGQSPYTKRKRFFHWVGPRGECRQLP